MLSDFLRNVSESKKIWNFLDRVSSMLIRSYMKILPIVLILKNIGSVKKVIEVSITCAAAVLDSSVQQLTRRMLFSKLNCIPSG